ncbi:MAG: YdgA family protein [Gammaproteobacteria bacterium]|nr:YdgA family protein [Gammaproteobacteria bacterium]MDP6617328.1 YdgA family protein [Gammaproteobacteria bacterium]MDP6694106.1 YdgA family protein [Gammaproteobacteria bacterium]
MKKLLLILIILVAAALLLLPSVAGRVSEARIRANLNRASENGFITFSISGYESGWLSSRGQIELGFSETYQETLARMAELENQGEDPQISEFMREMLDKSIVLDLKMNHGPLALGEDMFVGLSTAVIRFNPTDEDLATVRDELGIDYFLEIRTRTGFDGTTVFDADIPPVDYTHETGVFDFSGLQINGEFDGDELSSTGHMDSFTVNGPAVSFEVINLRVNGSQQMYSPHLWLGTTQSTLDSIIIETRTGPSAGSVEIRDIRADSDIHLNENPQLADLVVNYHLGSIMGADIDLRDLKVGLKLLRFDIDSLQGYYNLTNELALLEPDALAERAPELREKLYKLLAGSPAIAIDPLEFSWDEDAFQALLQVEIHGNKLPPEESWDPTDTEAWPAVVAVNAEASIARNMAIAVATQTLQQQLLAQSTPENPLSPEQAAEMARQQAPAMLDILTTQGMLTKSDDGYATRASFDDNVLTVNGMPIPLGAPEL